MMMKKLLPKVGFNQYHIPLADLS